MSRDTLTRPFRALSVANYRRYFTGQMISISGNWMQIIAEMWLVLRLTNSSLILGLTASLQFLPILLGGAWGGLLADRVSKRKLLMFTQTLMAVPALILFTLTVTGSIRVWMVLVLVFVRGSVNAVDNPARQSFVSEMVGREHLVAAVGLNSLIVQSARIFGPGVAGLVIAAFGVGPCFLLNALSFGAMLLALRSMDPAALRPSPPAQRAPGQLRLALRHVLATPELRLPLGVMALVGTLSFNFQVILPLMARRAFDGGASTYAALTATMAAGAVAGALVASSRGQIKPHVLTGASLLFGLGSLAAAAAPSLPLELAALVVTGAASVTFAAGVNSTVQLAADPQMRGRVMSLYAIVFLGSTPIGAPIAGALAGSAGPRSALVLAGVAALTGAAILARRGPARGQRGTARHSSRPQAVLQG